MYAQPRFFEAPDEVSRGLRAEGVEREGGRARAKEHDDIARKYTANTSRT